jgi:hypothetical protein
MLMLTPTVVNTILKNYDRSYYCSVSSKEQSSQFRNCDAKNVCLIKESNPQCWLGEAHAHVHIMHMASSRKGRLKSTFESHPFDANVKPRQKRRCAGPPMRDKKNFWSTEKAASVISAVASLIAQRVVALR